MEKLTITFTLERETKNTIRYEEQAPSGKPNMVGTLYLQKWALGEEPPKSVTVTIESD